jgi:hypothetical protein
MTQDVPFTVSPAADAHLRVVLRYVAETVPETADLVPVLCRGRSMTTWTWRGGSALPEYLDEEYFIGYYCPEQVAGWPRVRVALADLAASPETLEQMRGLHLIMTGATEGEPLSGRVTGRRFPDGEPDRGDSG